MHCLSQYFPACEIFDMPQRSESWNANRKFNLTASWVGAWLADLEPQCRMTVADIKTALDSLGIEYRKSALRPELLALLPDEHHVKTVLQGTLDAQETAICKILGGMSGCEVPDAYEVDPDGPPPRNPSLWAIWNGIRLEPEACACFERDTGLALAHVGYCRHESGVAGCSPDGLIDGLPEGFEGKAPLPDAHCRYLRAGVLPDNYRDQVHFSMAVTGAAAWHFQSYCPGLPPFRVRVERDDYTERMLDGIWRFSAALDAARDDMAERWEKMNTQAHQRSASDDADGSQ